MKKVLFGFFLAIGFTAFATVNSGQVIKADLINKILDIQVPTGTNVYTAVINADGTILRQAPSGWLSQANVSVGSLSFANSSESNGTKIDITSLSLSVQPHILTTSHDTGSQTVNFNVFSTATSFNYSGYNQNSYYHARTAIQLTKQGADYHEMKSIRDIILELSPSFFD